MSDILEYYDRTKNFQLQVWRNKVRH